MTPEQEERRGIEARRMLDSDLFREAFSTIEDRLVSQMAQAEIPKERAEYLRSLLVANRKIRQYMEMIAVTGRLAGDELEKQRTFAERMKDRFRRAA